MMAEKRSIVRKGVGLLLVIALVMTVTLATSWAGMRYPENLSAFNRWMESYQSLWLLWRLSLYGWLLWGSRKIWQRVKHQAEHRIMLIRMRVTSLLFILLGECALSGAIEVIQ
ncbi:hypothetical protein ACNFJN_15545 [Xenorhabdus budapestensis]|uniref:hypothetical protein n=1 Tax=Xenorhabdus TaxID=626 RepID=UPI0021070156|nr:hypothetical protein [Xenorhabdus sp. TS4]MBC8949929.1 exported protein [Xenorhabdus sp. TS4]